MNLKPKIDNQPVPVHPSRRWREFRVRFLPILVFVGVAGIVGHLWQGHVAPTQMSGIVVGHQHELRSPRPGMVAQVLTQPFQRVAIGDPLLILVSHQDEQLRAEIAVLEAEIASLRVNRAPAIGLSRNQIDYEDLRFEVMTARIRLAEDQLEMQRLMREAHRQQSLFDLELIAESAYDEAITQRDRAMIRVEEGEQMLDELDARLTQLRGAFSAEDDVFESALLAAVRVKEEQLAVIETQLRPWPLPSPADGVVAKVHVSAGGYAGQGDPLITLHDETADHVLGYIDQPIGAIPERGSEVGVIATARRTQYTGVIADIGPQLVPKHEMLMRPGVSAEYALPVRIEVPPDALLYPGERVHLRL